MDRKTLQQYRALKREIRQIDRALDKLYARRAKLTTVKGKVQASEPIFPYRRTHVVVDQYTDPELAREIRTRILIKKNRQHRVRNLIVEIEKFIRDIPDSTDRQIFEMVYVEGLSFREVGIRLSMDHSTAVKRVKKYLRGAE